MKTSKFFAVLTTAACLVFGPDKVGAQSVPSTPSNGVVAPSPSPVLTHLLQKARSCAKDSVKINVTPSGSFLLTRLFNHDSHSSEDTLLVRTGKNGNLEPYLTVRDDREIKQYHSSNVAEEDLSHAIEKFMGATPDQHVDHNDILPGAIERDIQIGGPGGGM